MDQSPLEVAYLTIKDLYDVGSVDKSMLLEFKQAFLAEKKAKTKKLKKIRSHKKS